MHAKPGAQRGRIRARAAYSIAELASFTGLTRYVVRGLLDAYGVQLLRSGRKLLVPLTEIEDKVPLLWRNLWRMQRLRTTEGEATPTGNEDAGRRCVDAQRGSAGAGRESVDAQRGSTGAGLGSVDAQRGSPDGGRR